MENWKDKFTQQLLERNPIFTNLLIRYHHLVWPEKPVCHDAHWREPEVCTNRPKYNDGPRSHPYRSCSYCGSIHPQDLFWLLHCGAVLGGSDWKYGWPHKFYVENIPNPLVGLRTARGSRSGPDIGKNTPDAIFRPTCGHDNCTDHGYWVQQIFSEEHSSTHAKWYNEHITDITDLETRDIFLELLYQHSGIKFEVTAEQKLRYYAPYRGYQR